MCNAQLGLELGMSAAEAHASVKRAEGAGLLHGAERGGRPNRQALEEFLVHGVKYAFPAERGEWTRGLPTGYAAEPLCGRIAAGAVWPSAVASHRGCVFAPLHKSAPEAAA